jgi:hypothetical protein
MFVHPATCVAEFTFRDNGKGSARLQLRFPFSTSYDTMNSIASLFASRLSAISDALLVGYRFRWNWKEDAPDAPGILSNVGYYLCLYYSNGVDYEPVFIPSPNQEYLETTGSFAGIRLDLSNPAVVSLADALTTALLGTVDPNGGEWGRVLVVGGRTL